MPERRSGFMPAAAVLLTLAFVVGFFVALISIGRADVLYKFALSWEAMQALIRLADWAPAIVLVAAAIATESSDTGTGFSGAARGVLAPALALATVLSLFYLLVLPGVEERSNRYESQSQLFTESIRNAEAAYREGRLADAERALLAAAAIDQMDDRFVDLSDRIRSEAARARSSAEDEPDEAAGDRSDDASWRVANRFYLEALRARDEGRLFDAHYLAKRSAAIYANDVNVRRLVAETWSALQELGPSLEEKAAAAFYRRKLEGYSRYQEGDFLEAFRIYTELAAEAPDDADVAAYLERSARGLSELSFFIEEDERAFSRSDERPFSVTISGPGSLRARLSASRAAASEGAVYFRDLSLSLGGDDPLEVRAPFARLHGDRLILRAVDKARPDLVWEPEYSLRPASGAGSSDPGYALIVPFTQEDALTAIRLSGSPDDIPLAALATGLDDAERLGIAVWPLRVELAERCSYPFAALMLALLGVGLGLRFRPLEPVGAVARYLTAPVLVALAIPPLRAAAELSAIATKALAILAPGALFLPAWIGVLSLCVVGSLLIAARIASRKAV